MSKRLLGLLAVATAAVLLCWFKVVDYDVFFHIKTGQVVLETGRLVRTNLFSSSYPDYPWPNAEWLFQVLIALVYRAGGWLGIQTFRALLVVVLGATLSVLLLWRGVRPLVATAFAIVPLALMRFRFQDRPQLLSYIFFTLVLLAVDRARCGKRRVLWMLPLLFALWSNIQPELLIGLLYLCGVTVGEFVNRRRALNDTGGRDLAVPLAAATAACLGSSLLNPEGYHVLTYPFLNLFLDPVVRLSEFQVTPLRSLPLYWAFLALSVPALLLPRGRRDWAEILPAAGLGVLGIMYLREISYFVLFAAACVPPRLQALEGPGALLKRRHVSAFAVAAAAATLLWAFRWDRMQPYRWGWGIDEDFHPVAAANALLAEPWQGNLYNHYNQGGYLIFRLFPRYRVLQDGRFMPYPKEFMARLNSQGTPTDWPKIVAEFGLNIALVPVGEAVFFSPAEWGLVFWDDAWCLLARRTPGQAALLRKHEYRFFRPGRDLAALAQPESLAEVVGEMARNQDERIHANPELANNLGVLLLRLGRRNEAEMRLRQAVELNSGSAAAWTNLGLLLAEMGRNAEARHALGRALALDPGQAVVRSRLETLPR